MLDVRILIAEDDEDLRDALVFYLGKKGYGVTAVEDGRAALDELARRPYDLLLADLVMPVMTGVELITALKASNPEDPPAIIVMTGLEKSDTTVKAIKAGVSFFLRKPLIMDELEAAVFTALDRRRLDAELKRQYMELDGRVEAASRDLQKKVNQLVILNEIGNMVRASRTLEDAARSVAVTVGQGLGFDAACLWLVDDDGGGLTLAACHGAKEPPVGTSVALDGPLMGGMAGTEGDAAPLLEGICGLLDGGSPPGGCPERSLVVPLIVRDPNTRDLSCWEHFGCNEKGCPAYRNSLACWMVEDSCVRRLRDLGTLLDKMELCKDCDVYSANRRGRVIGVMCVERSSAAIGADDAKTLGVYANTVAASLENIRLMERLVKDERFIDSILFNMSSGLMVTANDGVVRMINHAGASIFRAEQSGLLGKNIVELFPEAWRLIAVEDSFMGHEVVVRTVEGDVSVGYSNSRLIEHEGVSDGVIVVFRDLSEIKKLQDRIREADRFAAIGKVAAGVAHEIRNPLFGITSVAQILAREAGDESPHKPLIDAMLSEASRLNTLVEELLLYGRATKAALAPTDIHALMEGVLDFHAAGITGKGIRLVKEFEPGAPPLMLDPHQMRQVFLNLLYNSLDAVPDGGEIRLRTAGSGKSFVVRISDTGAGIAAPDLPKVFDLFFTTKEKGTGLGLAICRKIVEDHGGTLSLQSIKGKGTTVEIVLPAGAG